MRVFVSPAGCVIGYKGVVRWTVSLVTAEGTTVADVGTEGSQGAGGTKELEVVSTTVTTGGIDCETRPEREAIEGAAGGRDADGPEPASLGAGLVVVDVFHVGVSAGSGFVTFDGEAPALRLKGDGFELPSLREGASPVVKEIF